MRALLEPIRVVRHARKAHTKTQRVLPIAFLVQVTPRRQRRPAPTSHNVHARDPCGYPPRPGRTRWVVHARQLVDLEKQLTTMFVFHAVRVHTKVFRVCKLALIVPIHATAAPLEQPTLAIAAVQKDRLRWVGISLKLSVWETSRMFQRSTVVPHHKPAPSTCKPISV